MWYGASDCRTRPVTGSLPVLEFLCSLSSSGGGGDTCLGGGMSSFTWDELRERAVDAEELRETASELKPAKSMKSWDMPCQPPRIDEGELGLI